MRRPLVLVLSAVCAALLAACSTPAQGEALTSRS
jgi:predicted small secreted protein